MKAAQYTVLALASALAFGAPALAQPSTPSSTPKVLDVRDLLKEVSISALVTAIDPKNRIVTLKGPEGNEFAVMVDARVKNLAQVKVGDMVDATYIQSVALDFQTGNGIRMASSTAAVDRAQVGQLPGGAAMKQTTMVSNIWAIDQAKGTVMVRGPFGHFTEVKLKDPAMLNGVKVGDQMKMTITQAIATSIVRKS
ncbi:hypothetical protein [Variovorax saccharolyticus]|uniref:hypothetical protein n=1 Tax=Variovorax saccharolyticus TaxID=3053516 RepID=UPI002575405D|nr:hypothetical protein [Variovorax sp. J22R187]MDM0021407.1 hypothetical protein [Variovorax sp. J22R187]